MARYLTLRKNYNKNGEEIVTGAATVFIKKHFDGNLIRYNEVDRNGKTQYVANLRGSYKVDDDIYYKIKGVFGIELAKDSFIDIEVALWGSDAKAISKWNLNEGDRFILFVDDAKIETFARKDGTPGIKLVVKSFGYIDVKSSNKPNGTTQQKPVNTTPASAPAPSAPAPSAASSYPDLDDYSCVDDSDDLPF